MTHALVIFGAPRTKKNSQAIATNQATGATFIAKDKKLQQWEKAARTQLQLQWGAKPPIAGPVQLRAMVYAEANRGDLLNYLAAVSDILQQHVKRIKGVKVLLWSGVYVNDVQVKSVDGSRLLKDDKKPRVEIYVTELAAPAPQQQKLGIE